MWCDCWDPKDLPQSQWAPASADGPQPQADSDAAPSQQPPGQEAAPSPAPAEQPPEPSAPEESGTGAPPQEPESPWGAQTRPPRPGTGPARPPTWCSGLADAHVLLQPGHTPDPSPAPSSRGCQAPGRLRPTPRAPRFLRRWCPGEGGAVTSAVGRGHAQFGAYPAAASLRVPAGRGRVSGSWWRGAFAQQGPHGFGLDAAAALGARAQRNSAPTLATGTRTLSAPYPVHAPRPPTPARGTGSFWNGSLNLTTEMPPAPVSPPGDRAGARTGTRGC
ncbi:PREDICTED: proline-rich protein 2-like [Lipotes vexillifer]|uniref:Proline-rich protein 2-like n=1 Tax=Lipotes vexillifer TaxID=118797 RepID=A0A340XMI7_LIPVE|nr:PREDICTED: proline-rich protein 2-like [Lipotes vexillifer]